MPQSLPPEHAAIAAYLESGHTDELFSDWPGRSLFERAERGTAALKAALIAEIQHRAPTPRVPRGIPVLYLTDFVREKVAPLVIGLFPRKERDPLFRMFEQAIVFLTPENIERVIVDASWLHTAWDLANLYLVSVGATPLGGPANAIVGLSEATTCYVSIEYFTSENRFADFVVHEAAHVFHNCKRHTIGLPETRRREWLLDIDFRKRETFAYACEAYSRILELGRDPAERRALVEDLARGPMPAPDSVDPAEYLDILREAATARNGWKRILARCAPKRRPRTPALQPAATPSIAASTS